MRYEHVTDPKKLINQENSNAQVMTNLANIDYVAMMADIEIPTEEEEEGEEDE